MSGYDQYSPIALQAAAQYGVPPQLFLWQIGQESGWNPTITSDNGAHLGLGQFDVATANQYGVNRADPTSSIYGAALYDSVLYKRYGNWTDALTHYGTIGPYVPSSVNQAAAGIINGLGGSQPAAAPAASGGCTDYWVSPVAAIGFPGVCKVAGAGLPGVNPQTGAFSLANLVPDFFKGINASITQYFGRFAFVIFGLILIAGGLYLFGSPSAIAAKVKGAVT